MEFGRIGNHKQRAVTGRVAHIDILLDDRAADRGGHRINLKRMARFHPGQHLAAADLLTKLAVQRHDQARKPRADIGLSFGCDFDPAAHVDEVADRRRSCGLDLHAAGLRRLGRNDRAAFIGLIGPFVIAAAFGRRHPDVEAMRFGDHPAAAQEIVLPGETESVDPAAEATEFDRQSHFGRLDRLVVAIGVDAELGIDAIFEDGDLKREGTAAKHASPVRATFIFARSGRRVPLFRRRCFAACGKHGEDHDRCRPQQIYSHRIVSILASSGAWRPKSRSSRTPSK